MFRPIFRIILGVVLLGIGLIGGLIPIFQGWVFGLPGLVILSDYFPLLKRIISRLKKKIYE
tara:strand:+ start:64 stop:246 length:183 start_codon:yes stop_codon:yes gene_type:complete